MQYYKFITNKLAVSSTLKHNQFVFISIVSAGVVMLFTAFFFGFYYEDNQVVLVNLLYYARPNEMLVSEWMNDFDFLLVPFWAVVAQKITAFPFYAVWQLLQPFLWLYAFFYFFVAELKLTDWRLKIAAILLVVFLGLDSLVSQICFRNSIFLAGAALLFTRHRLIQGLPAKFWPTVLFVFALIPRSHPAAIVLALFVAHEVMMGLGIKKVVKAHVPHFIACIIVIGSYQLYGTFAAQNTGKVLEAEYEYAWFEKGAYKPLSDMTTAKDSLKYWAIQQWFIADSAEFNLAFIDRVVDRTKHYKGILSPHTYTNALREISRLFTYYGYFSFLLFTLLMVCLLQAKTAKSAAWVMLVYAAILIMLLFFLVDDIKERFFVPFTALVILLLFADWAGQYKPTSDRLPRLLFFAAAIVTFTMQYNRTRAMSLQFYTTDQQSLHDLTALHRYSQNHAVLFTIDVPLPVVRNVFHRFHYNLFANLAWVEAGYMTYYPYMEARIKNVAGFSALRFSNFLNAAAQPSHLRLITSESRMEVLSRYSSGIYGKKLLFTEDTLQPLWHLHAKAYVVHAENL